MPHDTAHDAKAEATHVERKLPPEIPEDRLDPDAVKVVRRLRRAGFTAYLVGGCVRDLLFGMRPKDFDVATSAHPNQVKETFRNSRLIGRRFRLAHVFFRGGKIIEVSTFRANPLDEVADLPQDLLIRHDNVFGNAEEDARRRDFTINALFYDVDEGRVVDHVGGKADLAEHLVRRGPTEAERHLRALEALDAHVRVGEIPSDAVLLATLLASLPRGKGPRGPIPRPGRRPDPAQQAPAAGEAVAEAPEPPPEEADELDEELSELSRELDETGEGDPAHAPLLEGALRVEEPHDDRLEPTVTPAFSVGGVQPEPWSLPQDAVAPEIVLAEMVRTARLPRRIAERARLVLAAQPLLSGERKKRRFSPQAFARQSIFPEALAVFELSVAATGRGADQLQKWQAIFAGQDFSQLEPDTDHRRPARSASASPGPPRRRRRGGRSRSHRPSPKSRA